MNPIDNDFLASINLAKTTYEDPNIDWETKYNTIFEDIKLARRFANAGIRLDWYDPDTTYEEDVRAFMEAVLEYCKGIVAPSETGYNIEFTDEKTRLGQMVEFGYAVGFRVRVGKSLGTVIRITGDEVLVWLDYQVNPILTCSENIKVGDQ